MGLAETSLLLPSVVIEHDNLAGLWHSLKYSYGSPEDRKAYIIDEFQGFLDGTAPSVDVSSGSSAVGKSHIDDKKLQQAWRESSELLMKNPDAAIEKMQYLVETLCYQFLKNLKVIPDPLQHNLSALVTLTERSLLLSPGKKYHLVVQKLVVSCGEVLAAIDNFTLDCVKIPANVSHRSKSEALVLIGLYGSLASLLLSVWQVRSLLKDGSMQR
jgi:hypothetical protein